MAAYDERMIICAWCKYTVLPVCCVENKNEVSSAAAEMCYRHAASCHATFQYSTGSFNIYGVHEHQPVSWPPILCNGCTEQTYLKLEVPREFLYQDIGCLHWSCGGAGRHRAQLVPDSDVYYCDRHVYLLKGDVQCDLTSCKEAGTCRGENDDGLVYLCDEHAQQKNEEQ